MIDQKSHDSTSEQADMKWIRGDGLRAKLMRSHLAIALLGVALLCTALTTVLWMRSAGVRLAKLDGPLAVSSTRTLVGLQHSLAGLGGWMALGEESFRQERTHAWKDEIQPSLAALVALSRAAEDSEETQRLRRVQELLLELQETQWWIEDVAHTPGNTPARVIMIKNAEPIGDAIGSAITTLIDLEKRREAGAERKSILGRIADLRFAFASCRTSLRKLVADGDTASRLRLRNNLDIVSDHIVSIGAKANLFAPNQQDLLNSIRNEFAQYQVFCDDIIAMPSQEWNVAQHLLATQAAPIAAEVTHVLENMTMRHSQSMKQASSLLVTASNIGAVMLVLMLTAMAATATLLSIRGARRITRPIALLARAAQDLAGGRLFEDIPVTTTDELGELTGTFNEMRHALQEREGALRESEARTRAIVDTATDGIVTIDEKGTIQSFNGAAEAIFGYSDSEAIGQNVSMLMPSPFREEHDTYLQRYLETGVRAILDGQHEMIGRRKDGSTFPIEIGASEVRFDTRRMFTGIVRDITKRKQAEAELDARSHRQMTVAQLGQLALADTNLSTLINEAVVRVAETLDVEYCKILELQPNGKSLRLRAGVGWKDGLVGHATVGTGLDSQAGYTLRTNEPVIVQNLRVDRRFNGPPLLHDHGVISGISVTIGKSERPFGVLGAHTAQQRSFTEEEAHFLESVSYVIAEAVTRKLVDQELSRRAMEAELLHRAASLASEADSLEDTLQQCLAIVCEMTGWPVGHVYLMSDDGTDELISSSIWNICDEAIFATFRAATERTRFRVGIGLPGRIFESEEPVWIRNVQEDPNFPRAKSCSDTGIKGAFGFPVKIGGKTVAVLEFFARQDMDPDEDLLAVMRNIGAQLGRVFERKRDAQELALYATSVDANNLELHAANEKADEARQRAEKAKGQLEAAQQSLMEASRQAGMAEIATGVLHNVGNVLNSVNVSASIVSEKLRKSKVANLAKAADLMREHGDDLGAFLTENEKGRKLPGYLTKLAEHLSDEHSSIAGELESLTKNIEHIKKIVSTQQSHAGGYGVVETASITEVVDDALIVNVTSFERYGIEMVREYADLPPIALDKQKLLQIMVNLVRNAKHATLDGDSDDKRLTLRIAKHGEDRVRIEITDTGVGISEENLTRIFSYGFTTKKDGHGFGLHSAALAAKEMGGSLSVHSDGPGKGATFTLELPLESAEVTV